MVRSGVLCLSLLFWGDYAEAEVKEDQVVSLPGYAKDTLPSRHFSVSHTMSIINKSNKYQFLY
jgi:hypothetical protein